MTKKIYKYRLERDYIQEIEMPVGAQILTAQIQHGEPHIWAVVEPSNDVEKRKIIMVGTGYDLPDFKQYIGTLQALGGALVLHVFAA